MQIRVYAIFDLHCWLNMKRMDYIICIGHHIYEALTHTYSAHHSIIFIIHGFDFKSNISWTSNK